MKKRQNKQNQLLHSAFVAFKFDERNNDLLLRPLTSRAFVHINLTVAPTEIRNPKLSASNTTTKYIIIVSLFCRCTKIFRLNKKTSKQPPHIFYYYYLLKSWWNVYVVCMFSQTFFVNIHLSFTRNHSSPHMPQQCYAIDCLRKPSLFYLAVEQ